MSERTAKRWPEDLDQCQDFFALNHWIDAHPGAFTLEQAYARMLEVGGGAPGPSDLRRCTTVQAPWLPGMGFIRLAELHGDLDLAHDDAYLTALVGLEPGLQLPLMRADSQLREELVWGMLRQEGNRGVSLARCDRSSPARSEAGAGWARTLATSIDEGLIQRDRLLDALVDMLGADLPAGRAGWYSRTLRFLSTSADEAAARQERLCALLSSPVGATTTLAVGELTKVSRAGKLDAALFGRCCESALMGAKTNAVRTLAILRDNLGCLGPGDLEDIVSAALSFPHVQVQCLAVDLARDAVGAGLLEAATVAALVAQADLDPLVGTAVRDLAAQGEAPGNEGDSGPASASALSPAGGAALVPASAPLPEDGPAPLPPPRTALVPMSADDLVGRVGAIAQDGVFGLEFEILLAHLASSGCDPACADALRPLSGRLAKRPGSGRVLGVLVGLWLDGGAPGDGNPLGSGTSWLGSRDLPALMRERITEAAGLLARGQRYRLLATPTDDQGAVDPMTLVRRALENGAAMSLKADLTQALLRVDADNPACADALAILDRRADGLPSAVASRLRLALRGTLRRRVERHLASLSVEWVGRQAHDPRSGEPKTTPEGTPVYAFYNPRVRGADATAAAPGLVALADIACDGEDIAPHRYAYPASVRHFAVCLLASQWYRTDSEQLSARCYRALADHGGQWDALSAQLLALAMGEARLELRALGVEAIAGLVGRGALAFEDAVAGFVSVARTVKLNRWAQAFADLGDLDPRLALDLALAVAPVLEPGRTGVGKVLATMTAQYQRAATEGWAPPLDEGTLAWLSRFKGSSQAARYARALKEKNT